MFIWFAVASVVLVTVVFRSAAVDHRTIVLGALLPLVEAAFGGPRILHSLTGAVAVLAIVMLVTQGRRILRRRLLGIPIGLMCHLLLDGSFTSTQAFGWPLTSRSFAPGQIPEFSHWQVSLVLELVGIALAVWAWREFDLADPAKRERFLRDGRLDPPAPA